MTRTTSPTSRTLTVLEVLQTRSIVTGAELARKIAVDPRTVRRYVTHLQTLGIPIEACRGSDGGYRLRPGFKLPPMIFQPDEALALAIGLRAASQLGQHDLATAIASTQAKLTRVMPDTLRERMADIEQSLVLDIGKAPGRPGATQLAALAAATRLQQGVRLSYQDAAGEPSERDVDVYGLGLRAGAWYAVGHCHLRDEIRTFRLDRIRAVQPQARAFGRPAGFDVLEHLARAIAVLPRKHAVEVQLNTDLACARQAIAEEFGSLRSHGKGVRLSMQADELDWVARLLSGLSCDFRILKPAALRRVLAAHAQALVRCAGRVA